MAKTTPIDDSGAACGACKFFRRAGSDSFGQCKFNPPTVFFDQERSETYSDWPIVNDDEGACGQFKGSN